MKRDLSEQIWREGNERKAADRAPSDWVLRELGHAHRIHARIEAAPSRHWLARLVRRVVSWL